MTCRPLPLFLLPLLLAACGNTPAVVDSAKITQSAPTGPVSRDAGDQTQSAAEAQLLRELNAARAVGRTCGDRSMPAVGALTWNGYLAKSARAYAQDMATRNFFAHTDPDGRQPQQRAEAAGYTGWTGIGENIIGGYALGETTAAWLESPDHCKVLMDPAFREVGVAFLNQPGSHYGTYGVQEFGAR